MDSIKSVRKRGRQSVTLICAGTNNTFHKIKLWIKIIVVGQFEAHLEM